MRVEVRSAGPQDVDWLLAELQEFSEFFGSRIPLYGEESARPILETMIAEHLVLVAEREDGVRLGFISGIFTPHLFNPTIRVLTETFWWVASAHRGTLTGGKAADLLLSDFIVHGKLKADWVVFTLEAKSPVNERVLTRRGFRLQERSYLMEVS